MSTCVYVCSPRYFFDSSDAPVSSEAFYTTVGALADDIVYDGKDAAVCHFMEEEPLEFSEMISALIDEGKAGDFSGCGQDAYVPSKASFEKDISFPLAHGKSRRMHIASTATFRDSLERLAVHLELERPDRSEWLAALTFYREAIVVSENTREPIFFSY